MEQAIGIRLSKEFLEKIERLSKEEVVDRSTIIRKLVIAGYAALSKKKAAEKYIHGEISFSEAAKQAGLTLWEMEKYLVENGFKSDYSAEDLARELKILDK